MTETKQHFTVNQIARAARLSRQAVYAGLNKIQTSGWCGSVSSWGFEALPLDWQLEITRRGVMKGYASGEAFLEALPAKPWRPSVPWVKVSAKEQQKAIRLQKAMARALAMRANRSVADNEVESVGLADFKAEFGYSISSRHWRRLLARTLDRDAGEENWQRLEIYLDDRAFRLRGQPAGHVLQQAYQHSDLDEAINQLEDRACPTSEDRAFLWDATFRHFERVTANCDDSPDGKRERRQAKASIVKYLSQAFPSGTLAASSKSLSNRFAEKLATWTADGRSPDAIRDQRPLRSGNFAKVQFPDDLNAIRDLAIQLDGNISLAYRRLRETGKLSNSFLQAHPYNPRLAKSDVPDSVRRAITHEVAMTLNLRRSAWQARMKGPYIARDWAAVKPGDYFSADDITWNHYFRVRSPSGQWDVIRGECLLMTDLRTGYPITFLLIPGKYNGEHVRSLCLQAHDEVGLPRCGFYFEKGVWASRLITGDHRHGTPVRWREAENGICSAGLRLEVRHATTPRAKPIEGLIRILQERMRCIPGFVGFNERDYGAENVQKLIQRARRGDEQALKQFPPIEAWAAKISEVLEAFKNDPQNGKMVEGLSPAEAWGNEISQRPLRVLPADARYILSTHKKVVRVRQEGIVLKIRGRRRCYYDEHTGPLIGQDVIAFYNLEIPNLLTVSDLKRQNYFTVKEIELPALDATRDQLDEARRQQRAHMAHAKAIFGRLKHEVVSTVTRDMEQPEDVLELGRFHNQETESYEAAKHSAARRLRKLQREGHRLGVPISQNVRDPNQVQEGLELLQESLLRIAQKEQTYNGQ